MWVCTEGRSGVVDVPELSHTGEKLAGGGNQKLSLGHTVLWMPDYVEGQ